MPRSVGICGNRSETPEPVDNLGAGHGPRGLWPEARAGCRVGVERERRRAQGRSLAGLCWKTHGPGALGPATCRVVRDNERARGAKAGHLQGCAGQRTGPRRQGPRGRPLAGLCGKRTGPRRQMRGRPLAGLCGTTNGQAKAGHLQGCAGQRTADARAVTCRVVREDVPESDARGGHLQGCAGRRTGRLAPDPHRTQLGPRAPAATRGSPKGYSVTLLGTWRSLWAISSMETSRKVSTLALLTKRAGRYMSHTQASPIDTS